MLNSSNPFIRVGYGARLQVSLLTLVFYAWSDQRVVTALINRP